MGIIVENLSYIYSQGLPNESIALKDISFEINDGEFVGIIGHTGSGKSTLLQHLNGLLKPTEGTIIINGFQVGNSKADLVELRKNTGLVFQYPEYQLFEETVYKDVAFGPKNIGLNDEEIHERVVEALSFVKLDYQSIKEKSPFELSGGQKRRVAIAGVIAMKPKILILDEPTAGLDPKAHEDTLNMIENIHKEWKLITILVSHKMEDIARLSNKVLVMDKGSLNMMGTPKEIFSKKDKLDKLGLSVPWPINMAIKLKNKGLKINETPLTIEELAKEIKREKC